MTTSDIHKQMSIKEYPVKNTFIEYPCQRSISLEMFLKERETQSEPINSMSRLKSLEDDFPKPESRSTLGQLWDSSGTALGQLWDSSGAALGQLWRSSGAAPRPDEPLEIPKTPSPICAERVVVVKLSSALSGDSNSARKDFVQNPMPQPTISSSNSFLPREDFVQNHVQRPTMSSSNSFLPSEDFVQNHVQQATMSSSNSSQCEEYANHMQQAEAELMAQQDRTVVAELNNVLGNWSLGSTGHHFGWCKPCAFFWKDGCKVGQACQFCHSCPVDEKKKRTKQKLAWRQSIKAARTKLRYRLF